VYTGESSVFVKSEVDSNDITECSHDDQPMTGMLTSTDSLFISDMRWYRMVHSTAIVLMMMKLCSLVCTENLHCV